MFDGLQGTGLRAFSIAKVPVHFSLWFFVICVMLLVQAGNLIDGVGFVVALTVSILIHEMGHAIPAKIWKLNPSILLHGLGGLCFHQTADSDNKDLVIILSGPLLQIAVGLVAIGVMSLGVISNLHVISFMTAFIWISVGWGLFNLLVPFYPMDGGQTMLLILRRFMPAAKARDWMLKISFTVAIPMVIAAFMFKAWILGFFIAYMAYDNLRAIRDGRPLINRGTGRVKKSEFVSSMFSDMESNFKDEDYREAVRLCHLMRSAADPIPEKQMRRIWEILFVANVRMGDLDEAKLWKRKAPDTKLVQQASDSIS